MPLAKKTVLKLAKGFRSRAKNVISIARRRVDKALLYQYRDRRDKKRLARTEWIQKLNAAVRQYEFIDFSSAEAHEEI
jgi:large subunit ribosomal protein L20